MEDLEIEKARLIESLRNIEKQGHIFDMNSFHWQKDCGSCFCIIGQRVFDDMNGKISQPWFDESCSDLWERFDYFIGESLTRTLFDGEHEERSLAVSRIIEGSNYYKLAINPEKLLDFNHLKRDSSKVDDAIEYIEFVFDNLAEC